jgi:uncharacterized membrane protein YphA (DoxX/SURF4 family)
MVLDQASALQKARVFEGNTQKPFGIQAITLDLSSARLETQPYPISFPFRSLYVARATDSTVEIQFKPITQDSYQSAVPLSRKDCFIADYQQSAGFFYWDAQPGKSITLVFFVHAEFKSGSMITTTSGGVSIVDGSAITQANVTLAAATAGALVAADADRKVATIQNNTGASIWVGPSTVTNSGATRGFEVAPGFTLVWRNTAALYGYSVLGGSVHVTSEE